MSDDLVKRVNTYLSNGGLFNPEYMNHDAVRDLVIDCRDRIEALEEALREIRGWNDNQDRRSLKIAAVIDAALAGENDDDK